MAVGIGGLTAALHPKLFPTEDVVEEVLQLRWTETHQALCGLLSYTHIKQSLGRKRGGGQYKA